MENLFFIKFYNFFIKEFVFFAFFSLVLSSDCNASLLRDAFGQACAFVDLSFDVDSLNLKTDSTFEAFLSQSLRNCCPNSKGRIILKMLKSLLPKVDLCLIFATCLLWIFVKKLDFEFLNPAYVFSLTSFAVSFVSTIVAYLIKKPIYLDLMENIKIEYDQEANTISVKNVPRSFIRIIENAFKEWKGSEGLRKDQDLVFQDT